MLPKDAEIAPGGSGEVRLVGGTIIVVAILLAAYGLSATRTLGAEGRTAFPPVPPPRFSVSLGNWSGAHANVTVRCLGCGTNVTAGSLLTVELRVVPDCGMWGCGRQLNGTGVVPPFRIETVTPSLPGVLLPGGSNFSLGIRAPDAGGPFRLGGSANASPPPGPVRLTLLSWTPRNLTGGSSGIGIRPTVSSTLVAPGAAFNVTLHANNSSPDYLVIANLSVEAPFVLLGAGPGFPFELDPNWSWVLYAQLRAPNDSGDYPVTGWAQVAALPEDLIRWVNVSFVGVNASVEMAGLDLVRVVLPGEEFNGSVLLRNSDNVSHQLGINRTVGPWIFINGTPSGRFTIAPNATFRYYLTLSARNSAGTYALGIVFNVFSEPTGRPRTRRTR